MPPRETSGVLKKKFWIMANYGIFTSYTEVAKISKNITEWMSVYGDSMHAMQKMLDAQNICGERAEKYLRCARRLGRKLKKIGGDWYENDKKMTIR